MTEPQMVRLAVEGGIATITVDRPKALNALNRSVLEELGRILDSLERSLPRCVVIRGAGERAFVAGADIAEMEPLSVAEARAFARCGQTVFQRIEEFPVPVIASVGGFALGGGLELALACDLIVAADTAQLGQPEISLGIIPGFGGTQRLVRRVGPGKARYLIFTGTRVSAEEAYRMGLVDRIVSAAELDGAVQTLAQELASKPAFAMQQAKAALRAAWHLDIATGCEREADAFALAFSHPDRQEGLRAFLEKRPPRFA